MMTGKKTFGEMLAKGRKECWSPSQRFWMEISLYPAALLARTPITPNMVTSSWIMLQLVAAYLFSLGDYWYNILALILFNFVAYIGDHVDGNLARMTGRFSMLGSYLEQLALFFGTPIVFIALAIANFSMNGNVFYLIITLTGVLFWLLEKLIRINPYWFKDEKREVVMKVYSESVSFRNKSIINRIFVEIVRRGQPFNLLFFLIIFNRPVELALIYSALFFLEFLRKLYSTVRGLKRLDKKALVVETQETS